MMIHELDFRFLTILCATPAGGVAFAPKHDSSPHEVERGNGSFSNASHSHNFLQHRVAVKYTTGEEYVAAISKPAAKRTLWSARLCR